MRIIAGAAKGRQPVGARHSKGTRPVTDRVREAVFSIVGAWVEEATVLDLYAGSGSFGLEALSRGAATARFVENGNQGAGRVASQHRGGRPWGERSSRRRSQDYLEQGRSASFDLVFMDPPWTSPSRRRWRAEFVRARPLAGRRGRGRRLPTTAATTRRPIPVTWVVATDRRYGDTRIFRYEKESGHDEGSCAPEALTRPPTATST